MTTEKLIGLRQQLDEAIRSDSPEARITLKPLLADALRELSGEAADASVTQVEPVSALRIIESVWSAGSPPPEHLPGGEGERAALERLLTGIADVQKFALALANGDLSQSLKAKGLMAGSLKSLQANLRHLTWQARMIATGDLTQKVDFMGEFSDSFNTMVASLSDALNRLRQREDELSVANVRLAEEIAEVKRTGEKLREAYKDLEAFSYSASHDLRAPLRHMSGFAELLQKRLAGGADESSRHYASVISAASNRMIALVDDLLSFSRMGSAALHCERVDPADLIKDVIMEAEDAAKGRSIDWSVGRMPDVIADRAMLRLVFVNLVSNAVKYTGVRPRAEIGIGCEDSGDEFIFHVRDNGAGFDMQYADRLFGVFQRLHSQSEFEGTGIGLANVRRIITRHGGRTWAEGAVGRGATFYFSLPKTEAQVS